MRLLGARFLSFTTRSMSMSSINASIVRLGLCQMSVTADKARNIAVAAEHVASACEQGSDLVMLPEIWNGPYASTAFPEYAEAVPGVGEAGSIDADASPSSYMLTQTAKKHKVWLIGGSVSERAEDGKIYNTCLVVNSEGEVVGKHRKVHLFDIDVRKPKKMFFKESDTLSAGDTWTLVDTPWGKLGVGICYDIRFPDMAMVLRQEGARFLVYPAAFNTVTGPAHWELLARGRAVDNQVFVALCSPARVTAEEGNNGYVAYGHSTVVDPWGEVTLDMGTGAGVQVVDCNIDRIDEVRASVPYWTQKRADMYTVMRTDRA